MHLFDAEAGAAPFFKKKLAEATTMNKNMLFF
jgi:hypothetical protein